MNRNNGRKIAVRLFALRDFLFANADPKHAITTEEIIEFYQSQEFENTSIKTVYSDLHAIRGKDYNIDVAYDEKAKGWLLEDRGTVLLSFRRCGQKSRPLVCPCLLQ